jgi:hypothetical protein
LDVIGCEVKGMVVDRGTGKAIDQIRKYVHHVIGNMSSAKITGESFALNEFEKLRPDIADGFGFPDVLDLGLGEG